MTAMYAEPQEIVPGVLRITAPNPGPMTGPGTNSYIVGSGPCMIVDPGVDDAAHLDALKAAAPGQITAIVLTHAHPDHSGGAQNLAADTGAPIRAYGKQLPGIRDESLQIDELLADGDVLKLGDVTFEAVHTPGHTGDHLCFYLRESRLLLAGDTVMADVTVVILPPDGRMTDYFASLERLQTMNIAAIAPGHGRMLEQPQSVLKHIVAHRQEREAQVRATLASDRAQTPQALVSAIYTDLDPRLKPVAAAQVQAHLIRLAELGQAIDVGDGWTRA